MSNKRKRKDKIAQTITYIAASISIIALGTIFYLVLSKGIGLLNWDLITGDYEAQFYNGEMQENVIFSNTSRPDSLEDDVYYSEKWGLGIKDGKNKENKTIILVVYVAEDSPLHDMVDKNENNYEEFGIKEGDLITAIKFDDKASALSAWGAEHMINELDSSNTYREIVFNTEGGGIRGSIITTLYLIGLTLLVALPIGIFTAIYLNEFAGSNRLTNALRSMIEVLTGVPSIIFGLMGLAVFVPLVDKLMNTEGTSIISGALTLAVILLPVIIRSTEESLKVVPDDFRSASLALGANHTQTTFKVVLPSAIPGILTGTLLAIGRIIGESAALIFAVGTLIRDEISIFTGSTTLSVHIWSLMKDEPANIELASTIALLILFIVLILNLSVKLISKKFVKDFN